MVKKITSSSSSSTSSKSKRKNHESDADYDDIGENMAPIRKLRASMKQVAPRSLQGIKGIREVRELNTDDVTEKLEDLIVDVILQILKSGSFELTVPNRATSNQRYLEDLDRNVLGDKVSKRLFLSTNHVRKTAITTRVMELVHEVLDKGIHITKRDLFYTDVKLFKDQSESDGVLDDVACMAGCTRTSLHIVASDKGLVVGNVQYTEAGDEIDCTRMGVGGKAIPPYVDQIQNIRSNAEFILLVEKEAAYMRLAEDRFYQDYPCIIITGKGQPDVATRLFLRKLKDQLNIPVLGLVDSDPYGLKILSVYCSGSKSMSYDSFNLTTKDIKWLGVRPSDLDKYNLPEQCRLPMTEADKKLGRDLLDEPFVKKNPKWVKELKLMLETGTKAEIQALSSFGFQYITQTYLPRKLKEADWI